MPDLLKILDIPFDVKYPDAGNYALFNEKVSQINAYR